MFARLVRTDIGGFYPDALSTNRDGNLTPQQVKELHQAVRGEFIAAAFPLVFGVLAVFLGATHSSIYVLVLGALLTLWGVAGLWLASRGITDVRQPKCEPIQGAVHIFRVPVRGGCTYNIGVGDSKESFGISENQARSIESWGRGDVIAYVTSSGRVLVNIERSETSLVGTPVAPVAAHHGLQIGPVTPLNNPVGIAAPRAGTWPLVIISTFAGSQTPVPKDAPKKVITAHQTFAVAGSDVITTLTIDHSTTTATTVSRITEQGLVVDSTDGEVAGRGGHWTFSRGAVRNPIAVRQNQTWSYTMIKQDPTVGASADLVVSVNVKVLGMAMVGFGDGRPAPMVVIDETAVARTARGQVLTVDEKRRFVSAGDGVDIVRASTRWVPKAVEQALAARGVAAPF